MSSFRFAFRASALALVIGGLAAPACAADPDEAEALPAASSDTVGADIVITGNRLVERRALEAKKAADNVVEALYANDVGKLPDQNVAEAVRRLPGISVANTSTAISR